MSNLPEIRLKPGREKKLRAFYPWVQREEVLAAPQDLPNGALARFLDARGSYAATGFFHPRSRFAGRVLTLEDEPVDSAFFARRLKLARARRDPERWRTNAYRLAFAEADGLPGLIVDVYGDTAAVQVRAAGMERLRHAWLPPLREVCRCEHGFERSEMEGRREEGLEPAAGTLWGEPPDKVSIQERGLKLTVPVKSGLKTGFYLDQRENRRLLEERVGVGSRVLDLFCYTGGFALSAARAGANALGVDLLPEAVRIAEADAAEHGLSARFELANAFEWLETEAAKSERYDFVVLDPPALAKVRSKKDSAKWAIWKLVYLCLPLLAPGGRMLVCSCSYQMPLQELLETVRLAANDRGRRLFVEDVTLQAPDHPYLLQFPESLYLKCLWVREGG